MKETITITRKEGEPLMFRISEDKWDLGLREGCLIVNEKTGKTMSIRVPGGTQDVEVARTVALVPLWNVLDVQVTQPTGFTTA